MGKKHARSSYSKKSFFILIFYLLINWNCFFRNASTVIVLYGILYLFCFDLYFAADTYKKPLFLYAIESVICASHVSFAHNDKDPNKEVTCFLESYAGLEAIAVDPRSNRLFYSDIHSHKIYRIDINLKKRQIADAGFLISSGRGKVNGI